MNLSLRKWDRVHVLALLESARTTAAKAAEALRICRRQLRWLRAKLRAGGAMALAHGNRYRPLPRALPEALRAQGLALARGKWRSCGWPAS